MHIAPLLTLATFISASEGVVNTEPKPDETQQNYLPHVAILNTRDELHKRLTRVATESDDPPVKKPNTRVRFERQTPKNRKAQLAHWRDYTGNVNPRPQPRVARRGV